MEKVSDGLYVSVAYKGTLQDGQIFDTSEGRQPLEVKMGAGQLIKGFEKELMGMALNEKKTFTLSPEEAYGPVNADHKHTFPRNDIPAEMDPQVGQTVGLTTQDGQQIPARIIAVDEAGVTVDLNHPLAGQTLTFEIEVLGINATPTQTAGCGCGCDCATTESDSGCAADGSGCGCH